MRFELEESDIQKIANMAASQVALVLKPLLSKAMDQEDPLLTVEDCAAYLHVSNAWIYKRTALKEMPHVKMGHLLMFRRSELDAWIERKGRMPQLQDLRARLKVAP